VVGAHQDKESTAQQPSIVVVIVVVDDEIYQAADREKRKTSKQTCGYSILPLLQSDNDDPYYSIDILGGFFFSSFSTTFL
jgi:hypothetical protein